MSEHLDVLIVGAGLSGHRRRAPSAGTLSRQDLRDPRGARGDRRHLGPLPLPRHPLGLRHAHPRLPLPSLDRREVDRRRPLDPALRHATPPARAGSIARSASATRSSTPSGPARKRAGRSSAEAPAPARRPVSPATSSSCAAATTATTRATPPSSPASSDFAGQVIHPQHWPEDARLRRQEGGRDRQRRDRDDAGPGARQGRRAGDDAAALADLRRLDAGRRRARQRAAPLAAATAPPTRSCAGRTSPCRGSATGSAASVPELMKKLLRRGVVKALPPGYDVDTHFTPTYNPWDQRLCLVPDADLFRSLSDGSAEIVTDRIAELQREGDRARVGQAARRRHRRHRDRSQPPLPRRHAGLDRRRGARHGSSA